MSSEIVDVEVLLSVVDPATGDYLHRVWLDTPDWVDSHNVGAYLRDALGDPLGDATDTYDDLGQVTVGWWYPTPAWVDAPADAESFAVPHTRGDTPEPVLVLQARSAS